MSKKFRKLEVIDMANVEAKGEIFEETETTAVGKPKWSLKKKLLIGGGVVIGLVIGAFALATTTKTETTDDQMEDSVDDAEEIGSDVADSEEIPENVETQTD